ncbi:uncharacterized protein [Hyperolius riggenbachi]|uniref:uncharacterized protein isoform X2 n=1 Tax=Hyperolius riggenbachi TaxID=752182 RepID=UPI0035A262A8
MKRQTRLKVPDGSCKKNAPEKSTASLYYQDSTWESNKQDYQAAGLINIKVEIKEEDESCDQQSAEDVELVKPVKQKERTLVSGNPQPAKATEVVEAIKEEEEERFVKDNQQSMEEGEIMWTIKKEEEFYESGDQQSAEESEMIKAMKKEAASLNITIDEDHIGNPLEECLISSPGYNADDSNMAQNFSGGNHAAHNRFRRFRNAERRNPFHPEETKRIPSITPDGHSRCLSVGRSKDPSNSEESSSDKSPIIRMGPDETFPCSKCDNCFRTNSRLALHQRVHAGEMPFSCSECGKYFFTKSDLFKHQKIHTAEKRREINMEVNVDPADLVAQVHKRPELWDKGSSGYSNSIRKKKSWEAVTTHFYRNFAKEAPTKRKRLLSLLKTKWKSLRDRCKKDFRMLQLSRSGQAPEKYRAHPLYKALKFLIPRLEKRPTTENMDLSEEEEEPDEHEAGPSRASSSVETEAAEIVEVISDTGENSDQELELSTLPAHSTPSASPPPSKRSRGDGRERGKDRDPEPDILALIENVRQDVIRNSAMLHDDISHFAHSLEADIRKVPPERLTMLKAEILKLVVSFQQPHDEPSSHGMRTSSHSPAPYPTMSSYHSHSSLPPQFLPYAYDAPPPQSPSYHHSRIPSQSSSYHQDSHPS